MRFVGFVSGFCVGIAAIAGCGGAPTAGPRDGSSIPLEEQFSPQNVAKVFEAATCGIGRGTAQNLISCNFEDGSLATPFIHYLAPGALRSDAAEEFDHYWFEGSPDKAAECTTSYLGNRESKLFSILLVIGNDYWAQVDGVQDEVMGDASKFVEAFGGMIYGGPEFCADKPNPFG